MERILLLGGSGILGSEVLRLLQNENLEYVSPTSTDLDIRDKDQVFNFLSVFKPSWTVNCAAWTNVDDAEVYFDEAKLLNEKAVRNIASAANEMNSRVLHISTDYVFNGESIHPYLETSKEEPINRYGESKLSGEKALLTVLPESYVIRTSWLYGSHGRNFVKTIAEKALRNENAKVVDDQTGSPTYARDLGKGILAIIDQSPQPGIYNFSNSGSCTWLELARWIYSDIGSNPELVQAISSASLGLAARRPRYSLLSKEKWENTGLTRVQPWEKSLRQFLRSNFENTMESEFE
jgi:dTDP-4-dehydrorhamnose reductase